MTRMGLEFSRTSKKPTVSGVHLVGGKIIGSMGREVREKRLCSIMLRTLTFTHSEKRHL